MMTNETLARAAEILDEIDTLGRELHALVQTEGRSPIGSAIGCVQYFASEQLGLDPELYIPPARLAADLRGLLPAKAAA